MKDQGVSKQAESRGGCGQRQRRQEEVREAEGSPVMAGNQCPDGGVEQQEALVEARDDSSALHNRGVANARVAGVTVSSVKHGRLLQDPSETGGRGDPRGSIKWVVGEVLEFERKCDFFRVFQLKTICNRPFQKLCFDVVQLKPSVMQLGFSMMQLLLVGPRDGINVSNWIITQMEKVVSSSSTPPYRIRDVIPLPLPPIGAALKLAERFPNTCTGLLMTSDASAVKLKKQGRQQFKRLVLAGTQQLWRFLVVLMINGMNDDWKYVSWKSPSPTPTQVAALQIIDRWVEAFCVEPQKHISIPTFRDLVKSRSVDYSGDEVGHALPLRLEELEPGLPVKGTAGALSAVAAATGAVRDWVRDPYLTLKPQDQWPLKVPQARINGTKSEWYRVCKVLYERGIIESIPLEKVFHAHGAPVLNGAFAVLKKGKAQGGETKVTRLIMNFVPTNSFQRLMAGDLSTLNSSSAWTQLLLRNDEVLLWSGDDQRGAFYAWALPESWRPFMAFRWPVPGGIVGSSNSWEYVASRVIPMGWIQAVSLFHWVV